MSNMNGIIELRQTSENEWRAKYQGNYGLYTIKITTNGKKTVKFSCSCPSDYYPCKHIPIVEEAIAEQIAINGKYKKSGGVKIEGLLKDVSAEKLREFIISQAKYNGELYNALFLEFAANTNTKGNKYSSIIQKALASVDYDEEDYYSEEYLDIEILDQWLDKAQDYFRLKKYDEAILICKACIEEYSQWLHDADDSASDIFSNEYQSIPFEIIEEAAKHANKKKLFDYCLSEMKKKKYSDTYFYDQFHELLGSLAVTVNPDAFIALQDELRKGVEDMTSNDAENIIQRKIDFYKRLRQPAKAWALMEENIQIESFREKVVKEKIAQKDFEAAKKLINDFIDEQVKDKNSYIDDSWYEMLLDIAQKEKDIPAIKKLAYIFIDDHFEKKYFDIYKAAFSPAEWADEREKLLKQYDKKYFSNSAADLLAAEKDQEHLLQYIEKHLSAEELVDYYKNFASAYPEKTIEMFQKVIVNYAEQNTGRTHYQYLLSLLKKLSRIKGGKNVAAELAAGFRTRYKNRRAMMEILDGY
jgi:hypothetical protein